MLLTAEAEDLFLRLLIDKGKIAEHMLAAG